MSEVVLESPDTQAAAPTPAPAAAPVASPAPAATAPAAAPAAPAGSLMSRGAAAAPTAAPAAGDVPASPIPAKYQVKRDDGSIDEAASLAKWGDGHKNLEQRLGAGDAPPATPDDYQPALPAGLTIDALKTDPLYSGFLKGAHARGMSNADVSFVLETYQQRLSMAATPEVAEAALRKDWVTDDQMAKGLGDSFKAVQAFTNGDAERAARLEKKFGNDPDFIWLTAQVGRELAEDTSVVGGLSGVEQLSLESMMASPAYHDKKHPEHAVTVAKVQAMYQKKFPGN